MVASKLKDPSAIPTGTNSLMRTMFGGPRIEWIAIISSSCDDCGVSLIEEIPATKNMFHAAIILRKSVKLKISEKYW